MACIFGMTLLTFRLKPFSQLNSVKWENGEEWVISDAGMRRGNGAKECAGEERRRGGAGQ